MKALEERAPLTEALKSDRAIPHNLKDKLQKKDKILQACVEKRKIDMREENGSILREIKSVFVTFKSDFALK